MSVERDQVTRGTAEQQQDRSRGGETPSRGRSAQLRASLAGLGFDAQSALLSPDAPVQRKGGDDAGGVHAAASHGVAGGGGALPHGAKIQQAFGRHDVSGVQAHVGGRAAEASEAMGAQAYATGNHIAFKGAPDMHTAAHEAAHVVQQRAGVSLSGGVGKVGDSYERHADRVADTVVSGKSAEGLLDRMAGGGGGGGVQQRAVQHKGKDPGIVGGKTTLGDYTKEAGVTRDDVASAGAEVKKTNAMSLAQLKAKLGTPKVHARTQKQMLAAIASGVLPRFVARVHAKAAFDAGTFGHAGANQIFATEPADLFGLSPAKALVKVGWTPGQLKDLVGQEIAVCVLDTEVATKDKAGAEHKNEVGHITWDKLADVAQDPKANAYFHSQLKKYSTATATVTPADLPTLFSLAAKTPVGAEPDTKDKNLKEKYKVLRAAMSSGLGANKLYSGMGATISETGQVGAREVMVKNNGTGFKLEPGKNCEIQPIGKLDKAEVDGLISGK